jgi:hypothetical protein
MDESSFSPRNEHRARAFLSGNWIVTMGQVIPFRDGIEPAATHPLQAIGLACQKAARRLSMRRSPLRAEHATAILLQRIIDGTAKGTLDAERLCEQAFDHLREVELQHFRLPEHTNECQP